jgi:chemotaxis protein CheD
MVATVLGSCVSVTMFDPVSSLSSICHAMLAEPMRGEKLGPDDPLKFRYVSHAVPAMVSAYRGAGVPLSRIEVKLFGGGNVIKQTGFNSQIGSRNVEAARGLLLGIRFRIAAENTGGERGRKLFFNTMTGEVLLKHLRPGIGNAF